MRFFWTTPGKLELKAKIGEKIAPNETIILGEVAEDKFIWDVVAELDLNYHQVKEIFRPLIGCQLVEGEVIWEKKRFLAKSAYQLVMPLSGIIEEVNQGEVIIQPQRGKKIAYQLPFPITVEKEEKEGVWCQTDSWREVEIEWLTPYKRDVVVKGTYPVQLELVDRLEIENRGVVVDEPSRQLCLLIKALSAAGVVVNLKKAQAAKFCSQGLEWGVKVKKEVLEPHFEDRWLIINKNKLGVI